jgi:hypothetical protein
MQGLDIPFTHPSQFLLGGIIWADPQDEAMDITTTEYALVNPNAAPLPVAPNTHPKQRALKPRPCLITNVNPREGVFSVAAFTTSTVRFSAGLYCVQTPIFFCVVP